MTARKIAGWGEYSAADAESFISGADTVSLRIRHPRILDALQSFVVNTQGRLRELDITYLRFSNSRDYALELCRASSALLKELVLRWTPSSFGADERRVRL